MTLEECYNRMHGDYAAAQAQLMKDSLIERFLLKFPADKTMEELRLAAKAGDIEASFAAVHTLKGVALNLALKELHEAAHELTEQLRSRKEPARADLLKKLEDSYGLIIRTIKEYENNRTI